MNRIKERLREHTLGIGTAHGSNTISGAMPTHQILGLLRKHNCNDVTHQLDISQCDTFLISYGGFGDVFKGMLQGGDPIAIKCLRAVIGIDDREGRKQLRAAHEIYVWSKCKHPNVLELIGVAQYRGGIVMISPWMEKGNLNWYLSRNPTADKYHLCAQIADGVAHLHTNGIVHGDIKGSNILVSDDHTPKLADFGASFLSQYTLRFTRSPGDGINSTTRYTAPEILMEETKLTAEGDVYALGMTILEVITGTVPYDGCIDGAVVRKVTNGVHPVRPEKHIPTKKEWADALWELLTACWALDTRERPKAIEVAEKLKAINAMAQKAYHKKLWAKTIASVGKIMRPK